MKNLQPVLILTYYYLPCSLTASLRMSSWAEGLAESGYYPIVIARNWDYPIERQEDLGRSSGDQVRIERYDSHEVHYLPYRASWRDRKYLEGGRSLMTMAASMVEVFGQHFSLSVVPYSNLYTYTRDFLRERDDVRKMIVSVNPWVLFRFAHLLSRQFPDLLWVADYRDDWSTSELGRSRDVLNRVLRHLDSWSEKRWTRTAASVVSVSDVLTDRVSRFLHREGVTIPNGFDQKLSDQIASQSEYPQSGTFTVVYTGYLYGEQRVEIFIEAFKRFCLSDCGLRPLLKFIGLGYQHQETQRVLALMKGFEQFLEITSRMKLSDCVEAEQEADCQLMVAYGEEKGIPASKLYQYVGNRRAILLVPSDQDIIEQIIKETGLGFVANSEDEALEVLMSMAETKLKHGDVLAEKTVDSSRISSYSRQAQTNRLAALLDSV